MVVSALLELMIAFAPAPLVMGVDEERIGENLKHLKKNEWFQKYLNHDEYRNLVTFDRDVRLQIGRFNTNIMKRNPQRNIYHKKLRKVLQKKAKLK